MTVEKRNYSPDSLFASFLHVNRTCSAVTEYDKQLTNGGFRGGLDSQGYRSYGLTVVDARSEKLASRERPHTFGIYFTARDGKGAIGYRKPVAAN